jgi:hypothetical protein
MKAQEIVKKVRTCKWNDLENIILREVSQAQKAKSHMFSLILECRPTTNTAIL